MAARTALLTLAEAGLDTVVSNGADGSGDGVVVAEENGKPGNMAAGDG